MRLFLLGWNYLRPDHVSVASTLQKHGHEIVYWSTIQGESVVDRAKFPTTIFDTHSRARLGIPAAGVDVSEFSPPGKDLIDKMHKTESLILTMMNKPFDNMGVDERRHLYFALYILWKLAHNK